MGRTGVGVDVGGGGRGSIWVVGTGICGGSQTGAIGSGGAIVFHLLAGSLPFRPRDWATGSKEIWSSWEDEEKDEDGSSSARSLLATAVEAHRCAGLAVVLACLQALLARPKPRSLVAIVCVVLDVGDGWMKHDTTR